MNQDHADELFFAIKQIVSNIDVLMKHEIAESDLEVRKLVGEMSANFCDWLDFEFINLMKRKFPEISTKTIEEL